ncbi:efflux transporter outer membrane subunit [Sphingomonas sp.]|uniref:efflux transporter outer membrane subunit n=1 Tax=Sphingomonas sp. TaxID=28214 RepID=UPI0025CE805A|nr:efflux transporter outer membrane subunit [Sphingomonas sp.]
MIRPAPRASMLAALALLVGCTVGPRNPGTTVPLPPERPADTIAPASGPAQQLVAGTLVERGWWKKFGSAKLNALVDRALAANNDLAAADAALAQTRALARAVKGDFGPQLDAGFNANRTRVSGRLQGPLLDSNILDYTLSTAQLSVSYPLDLFGIGRNQIRSARAQAEVALHRRDAARTTVVTNLVVAVIYHAALAEQLAAAKQSVSDNRQILALLQRRQALGEIGQVDVAQQQTALANVEALVPPLERALQHQKSLVLTLTGQPAGGAAPDLPGFDELTLPDTLPLSLPAAIVANRPDVRAAEAAMRGAGYDVGTAIAARLPQLSISGTFGGQTENIANLLSPTSAFFAVIGGLTQPLFHSGALKNRQRAAEAALEAAKAQYRAAALQALLDVDDALAGLRTDAGALDAATRARTAAAQALRFTRRQAELGATGTLQLLTAAAADAQAAQALVQARVARLTDTVALYQACGTDSFPG